MRFTRAFDDTFTSDGGGEPYGVLAAHHPTEATLGGAHIGRTPFSFDLLGAPLLDVADAPASIPTEGTSSSELGANDDDSKTTARLRPSAPESAGTRSACTLWGCAWRDGCSGKQNQGC